jgi:hypothetical protein
VFLKILYERYLMLYELNFMLYELCFMLYELIFIRYESICSSYESIRIAYEPYLIKLERSTFHAYHDNNSPIAIATFSIDGIISRSSVSFSGTAGILAAPMVRTGASSHWKQYSEMRAAML